MSLSRSFSFRRMLKQLLLLSLLFQCHLLIFRLFLFCIFNCSKWWCQHLSYHSGFKILTSRTGRDGWDENGDSKCTFLHFYIKVETLKQNEIIKALIVNFLSLDKKWSFPLRISSVNVTNLQYPDISGCS